MKKITKVMALLLIAVMVLTGCATEEITVTINSGGSAKMISVLDIDKEAFDKHVTEEIGYSNPEEYLKSMLANYYSYSIDSSSSYYEIVTIDGKEYYELRDFSVASSKTLANDISYKVGNYEEGLYVTKDTVYGKIYGMEDDIDYQLYSSEIEAMGINMLKDYACKLSFVFPANIVSTNGVINKDDPKKVTFNLDMTKKENVIFATTTNTTMKAVKAKIDKENNVKKPTIKSLKIKKLMKKKASATLKLKKMKGLRFEIEYSTNKKFKGWNVDWKSTKKTEVTLKNLKRGKKYYVRVRAFKKNYAGMYVYSKWVKKSISIPKKKKKK